MLLLLQQMLQHAEFTWMEYHSLYTLMRQLITKTIYTVLAAQREQVKLAQL
jgi:hypothetical protein